MFLWARECYSSLIQPISSEVTGHDYISSRFGDKNLVEKIAAAKYFGKVLTWFSCTHGTHITELHGERPQWIYQVSIFFSVGMLNLWKKNVALKELHKMACSGQSSFFFFVVTIWAFLCPKTRQILLVHPGENLLRVAGVITAKSAFWGGLFWRFSPCISLLLKIW